MFCHLNLLQINIVLQLYQILLQCFNTSLKMLIENQISHFVKKCYKDKILKQIPEIYDSHQALLTLTLNIDLTKVFTSDKEIGIFIIGNYPLFNDKVEESILEIMLQQALAPPQHGLHLIINLTNCPMPEHNLESPQFLNALFQQKEGVLVYLKQAFVLEVSQPQLYLKSTTQVWVAKCKCEIDNRRVFKKQDKNLLRLVKNNSELKGKTNKENPPTCQECLSSFGFDHQENEIYMNCHKISLALRRRRQAIFQSGVLQIYVDQNSMNKIQVGSCINCCVYLMCQPLATKIIPQMPINLKTKFSAYMISLTIPSQGKSLFVRSRNNEFFSELRKIDIEERKCISLSDFQPIVLNHNSLVKAVQKINFPFLPEETLSIFKLAILNSIFNHHNNINLHICIIADEQELIINAMKLKNLEVRKWPNDYDQSTLFSWLRTCSNQIVIVSNPKKKDCFLIQSIINNKIKQISDLSITFWIVAERTLKKQINLQNFGIVIDLTFEKNAYICSNMFEQSVDIILSAFTQEEEDLLWTIPKVKNPKERFSLIETSKRSMIKEERSQEEKQIQGLRSRDILQRYYMKSRQYKKISESTVNHLIELAQGFSCMRQFFVMKKWPAKMPELSILDAVLVIFIDEETSRNKYSNNNTLFANEISKLLLNESDCEISFWDYEYSQDGTMKQVKNYLPKPTMLKRMLHKIDNLLYGDGLVIDD